jgi:tripartite-type tricarboxylate transporter receptor subunit TctC
MKKTCFHWLAPVVLLLSAQAASAQTYPSRTPRAIVVKLAQEFSRMLQLPDVKERYESQGAIAKATTPEAFGRMVRDEIVLRSKVFRSAGAKPG